MVQMPQKDSLLDFAQKYSDVFFREQDQPMVKGFLSALRAQTQEPLHARMIHRPQVGDVFHHATTGIHYKVTGVDKKSVTYTRTTEMPSGSKAKPQTVPHETYRGMHMGGSFLPGSKAEKSEQVKRPGSRGGRGYYDGADWKYGERPSPKAKGGQPIRATQVPGKAEEDKKRWDAAFEKEIEKQNQPWYRMMTGPEIVRYNNTREIPQRVFDILATKDAAKIEAAIVDAKRHGHDDPYPDPYSLKSEGKPALPEMAKSETSEKEMDLLTRFVSEGPMAGDEYALVPPAGFTNRDVTAIVEVQKSGMLLVEHRPWGAPARREHLHKGEVIRGLERGRLRLVKGGAEIPEAPYDGPRCKKCNKPASKKLPKSGYCDECLTATITR